MFNRLLKKKTKLLMPGKKQKLQILILLVLCILIGIFGLTYQNVYGENAGYALGDKSSGIVPGTVSGNAPIWPITHPVFVVRLYDSPKGMGTDKNGYDNMVKSIQTVIPYADNNAMWLCSNKLSDYLIDKGFQTKEQVYIARKESLSKTKLFLSGGEGNPTTRGRIEYLSNNEYKTFGDNINNGVFYNGILELYKTSNRSMDSLLKNSDFIKYLRYPTDEQIKHSMQLWSYITDAGESGSDADGWIYNINIKPRIDQFLHYEGLRKKGLNINNWNETSMIELSDQKITLGDSFNLRYLDLLMTLNAISNNKDYWIDGIKSYMIENKGVANISITQGIVGRFESISVDGGIVKPATVFVNGNDLTQDAYRVTSAYNLSDLVGSDTVYDKVKSENYITRLKAAVSLSKSKTYYTDTIYSSALISRLIKERVKSVEDSKLVWKDSFNPLNLISLLYFKFDNDEWQGTNWVLEPPISTSVAVNFQAVLKYDSKDKNKIDEKAGPQYIKDRSNIDLVKYYDDPKKQQEETVITDDTVNLQVYLQALTLQGKSEGQDIAIKEWSTFIEKNNISDFKILVKLNKTKSSSIFAPFKIEGRDFIQKHVTGASSCDSTDWETITSKDLIKLLRGKSPIGQWTDEEISKLKVKYDKNEIVTYSADVYIKYKAANGKWYYITGQPEGTDANKLTKSSDKKVVADIRPSNEVELEYMWTFIPVYVEHPSDTWLSEEPALAYAELKEGSIYNETFEAMAGVPSTRTLYFSSGGNEFMVDLQVNYEYDSTAIREYISHFHGTECEYKTNDQLKGGAGAYSLTETFVGDATGKTISKSVNAESSKIVEPAGNSSKNTTVSAHTSGTTLWSEWTGSINNGTSEPTDIGEFDQGKPGNPCAGLGFDVGKLRTKAEPTTNWSVEAYNAALNQAIRWAQDMEATNSTYTVQRIADSDGQNRQYQVGNAVISITLTGGDNSYSHTATRNYSGGTYTSGSASGASLISSDKGKLGWGWGWSDGMLGSGGGYVAGAHGHGGVCPGDDKLVSEAKYDKDGNKIADAVYGPCGSVHNCGYYNSGTDITQGASSTINYTIKVTFDNGTLKASNYDGNSGDVVIANKSGLTSLPAHGLCGPCCAHDLPAIEDVWYQEATYDTIQITKSNVYKLENGYVTDMEEITYDSDKNLIADITQGDPNIFYNIAANNLPLYQDSKLTNASKVGRIRYSLQEAQGDKVYYEEMASGNLKRTNKCDGLGIAQSAQNPAPLAKRGHELGFASGILYNNGKTAGYGTAVGLNIETLDFVSDNKVTVTTPKNGYGNKIDAKDLLTEEWKRFYTRRTQEITATVISDMLILQTSSGDQSPVYYEETTKAKAQEDFPSLRASGDAKKDPVQAEIDAKWAKMWTNYKTTFAKTRSDAIHVGSYNGKYKDTATKYQGTGEGEKITTRFDQDTTIFASPKDDLNLAIVKSNQSFTKPADGTTNIASPGKAQARMDRVTNLRILVDKIKQKPTNENAQYDTGESFVFYVPILKYNISSGTSGGTLSESAPKDLLVETNNEVLTEAGYHLGPGLTYHSKYSSYEDDNTADKVNDIIVLNAVSTQNAMIVKSEVEDQRTTEGIVGDAMETLKALEKCPKTPELCEYRYLSCKYTLDTTSLSFAFEDEIATEDTGEEDDLYGSYDGQLITNSIKNADGALPSYALPEAMTVTGGDGTYTGFGTEQFLKVSGTGTKLLLPYNDCRIYRVSSSRVKISVDVYIPSRPTTNTMLFSIGEVGLYLPANGGSPLFITGGGQTRAGINADIIGKKVKLVATFSLGSLYDCELAIDGTPVITRVTSGLTDAQIANASISSDMLGSGIYIGCWEYNNAYATNFYLDNLVITRCGGTLEHSASCYTTYRKENSYYQDTFNGLTSVNNKIDWTRLNDDGDTGVITNYSKHVHDASCLTKDSLGYQIAYGDAEKGDWTSLRKELGTTLFDKVAKEFNIDTSGTPDDMLTKTYNGKLWGRVFYQDSSTGQYFANEDEVLNTSSTYKYSCLNQIQNYKADSSKYEFMLNYPETGLTNVWKQTKRPQDEIEINSDGTQNAAGYEAVSIQMNGNYWGGLVKSTAGASLIDGSTYHSNWWYAIGSYAPYTAAIGSIPGGNSTIISKVELWMVIDTTSGGGSSNVNSNTSPSATIDTETEQTIQKQIINVGTAYEFNYTGTSQTFTVPADGTYKLEVWGAQGGGVTGDGTWGGLGGYAEKTITLNADSAFNIYVGGKGGNSPSASIDGYNDYNSNGGYNGGGRGTGSAGPGGGGATDIRTNGTALANRIVVAGGGGGNASSTSQTPTSSTPNSNGVLGIGSDGYLGWSGSYEYDNGGGGGGYYGGTSVSGDDPRYGYAGTSYGDSTSSGVRSGNGYAKITLVSGGTKTVTESVVTTTTVQNPTGYVAKGQTYTYGYTGNVQAITLPAGTYKLEAWGASGGNNYSVADKAGIGQGGYTNGTVSLTKTTTLYVYIGGRGENGNSSNYLNGTYNGGGAGMAAGYTDSGHQGGQGGGATDFRLVTGTWNNLSGLKSRILVAGGGGGTGCASILNPRGDGGGLVGKSTYNTQHTYLASYATGGSQTAGGTGYSPQSNSFVNGGFGYGASGSQCGAGGGGGYYGGGSAYTAGGGGGSSYVSGYTGCDTTYRANQDNLNFTDVSLQQGGRIGNGYAKITVLKTLPSDTELFNYIKANMNLIPDKITTDGITITNPIWNCKLINNTEKTYTEQILLTCQEPHHSGGHYDYANDICWSACGNDHNHLTTKQEVTNANGTKVEQAEYITLDNFFQVYFPNAGDFYGNGAYGILEPSINRGKGYIQNMETTEWTREKYVKFDFDVLYERNGVWESYTSGNWIPLEIIDRSTTNNYILGGGTTLYHQGNTYVFDRDKQLMSCNGRSTTLLDQGYMAAMNGYIFVLNTDGTVSVSAPFTEYNFYCLLSNNEFSCIEVQYAVEGINYDEQSTDATPYEGDDEFQEEYSIYRYGNLYNTNKQRYSDFTSNHTAGKLAYLDIVGRIGNFIIEDTDDMRFSNFFKKSVVESNDDWYIEGIISKVDSSISENYLSWHRNSAGYPLAVDVRGEQVSKGSGYYNTWGTQSWTERASSESLGVSADKNADTVLQKEQLKLGYNVLFDITTLGNYSQYLQAIPYFYALNTKTCELIPVDVYINDDGTPKPINYFGLYSEYMDDDGNYLEGYESLSTNLYKYNMYLNWTDEAARRNYAADGLESDVTDLVRDYFTEPIFDSAGDITGYKYLTVPYGNYYNLGTMQCLQPGKRARTFVGNSEVTAIAQQSARLGITSNGINGGIETNFSRDYLPEMFYRQAQRWHLTMGLPSSAIFTAYREKGVHVTPDEEWYVASYVEAGMDKTKRFSKTYLHTNVGNKEYVIGSTFTIADIGYSITEKYNAGSEFNNNEDYVILMTADIKAIGDVWNLKYNPGEDNGNITINGTKYHFGSSIPTFIAAYDTVSSSVDISTQQTH